MGPVAEVISARLPLVGVFLAVQVAVDEAFARVEEDAAVLAQAKAFGRQPLVARRLLPGDVAGGAVENAGWRVIPEDLAVGGVVIAGQGHARDEGDVIARRVDLEVAGVAGPRRAHAVDGD